MPALALPDHGVKTRNGPDGWQVFDPIRRKWVALLPEEWVRQHFLNFLLYDKGCPASLIQVEQPLVLNTLFKRADIVVHASDGRAVALVECKAPGVRITQSTFEQAARYNVVFKVGWLIVTNGLRHYCCRVDQSTGSVEFRVEIPDHATLSAR
ncbi:MAG: type I restriction enzyme HsdR N-terminal domain-containing protein [Flavobacteriales bacterium]|nr:type I restriction enzyme HsdR N-terminal domain-containing protein [Flavobacteriales bacterium]